jgi:Na+/H+ antiporter NhaD/arsenite permease-like protein
VDAETLTLLFGMMTLVALLQPTGAFEYLATQVARLSGGRPIRMLVLLSAVTTLLSMVLDNVTTVVLIAPVTVLITEVLGLSPIPFLISEAVLANTGGVATLIGDPPNIIIGSAANLTFNDFLVHSLPVVLVAWTGALGLLIWLFRKELRSGAVNPAVLEGLEPVRALRDSKTAGRVAVILVLTVLLFVLQSLHRLSSPLIAMSMASLALLWLRPELDRVLELIEWQVLVFFTGLFVMVGGLEASGGLAVLERLALQAGAGHIALAAVGILWLTAVFSALVDNIPITVALVPVIQHLGSEGLEVFPLWWALALGAGFGGNATIIGSTANLIVVRLSERTRQPISARLWLRRGLPTTLLTCAIGSLAFLLALPLFQR